MMIEAAEIIDEARRWVGTPFRHRGNHVGRGADCVGFIRGVVRAFALVDVPAEVERELETYSRTPNPLRMGELLATFLTRTDLKPREAAPDAHVAWLQWRPDLPMHLAITATYRERPTLIHALGERGVVEHGFAGLWRNRVHSYWRLPGVAYG